MKDLSFKLAFLVIFVAACQVSPAQVCGGGTNQINIYVRNGLSATNPQFHLYSASPVKFKGERMMNKVDRVAEYLSTTFFPTDEVYLSRWWIRPKLVRTERAEAFLRNYDPKDFEQTVVGERDAKEFSFAGKIDGDSFGIRTYEMDDIPYLLKVWADNYEPVYVLGAHRGGCSRSYDLLLTKYRWPSPK